MVAVPAVMAVVLGVLTWSVAGQFRARRRPQQLAWAVAIGCGLLGTCAFLASVLLGGSAWLFRLYYLTGAVLTAPLLGVGSAYLLPDRRWARALLAVTAVGAGIAVAGLGTEPLSAAGVAAQGIGPGTALVTGPLVIVPVVVLNTLGTIGVGGVALRSLLRAASRRDSWARVGGNGLILAGALLAAAAGSLARLGHGAGFWAMMMAGWLVLYAGFLLLGVRLPVAAAAPSAAPATTR